MSVLREISGWARWPREACLTVAPDTPDAIPGLLNGASAIARGLGRAYGDSAMNPDCTILTQRLNRILEFQPETGEVVAEAGVSFKDLIETFLPRGFFPSVTPGSKFVTLGGAIAADVHGDKQALALQRRIIEQAGLAQTDAYDPAEIKERILKSFEKMGVKVNRSEDEK
jgi:FAD/FMN-containing dehydrogenase